MPKSEVRFERHGGQPDLPAAFTAFVKDILGGRSLDDRFAVESSGGEFPDFGLYRDLLLIEMKHLENEQAERVQSVMDEKIPKEEMPIFYGQRKVDISNKTFSNGDAVVRAILTKLGRSLEGLLSKANRQLRSYRSRYPRKNAVNICVILNSRIPEYTPELVAHSIHSKMQSHEGRPRFEAIDGVLYISEKHFTQLADRRTAHPVVVYDGESMIQNRWKSDLLDKIVQSWAVYRTGTPLEEAGEARGFASVEDIPEQMSRSDAWLLEYARNPYLHHLTLAQLRVEFHRIMAVNALSFVIGSWPKPPHSMTENGLRRFQHVIAETNRRGLDMRELDAKHLTDKESEIVFGGLPTELVDILRHPNH